MNHDTKPRILKISILRFDPNDPEDFPHMETFEVEEAHGMTLYIVLNEIREHQDNALMFDFVCRAGICGSCSMLVNGRPTLACRTLTSKLDTNITLAPLPLFELIKDLSIYTGKWMEGLNDRLETWIHEKEETLNADKLEERMEPALADEIYELDRCVECGCCVAGCGNIQMNNDFVGAVGLNKVARFHLDPRDNRTDEDYYSLIGNEDGVFGCMTLLGCEDVCPKDLPLQSKIAYLRRMMVSTALK
ncbi:MAG: fumarate reductase iron-sulfur subunit [Sulfurimonas sp.]|jgi:fumarate reductase iron-sulfur subunit|uniref:fumarate reductase iron-sulfur subunit n=1 Tax=Sulfurimonas sp. TaxID=2022749 RepID=UPI0039E2E2AE